MFLSAKKRRGVADKNVRGTVMAASSSTLFPTKSCLYPKYQSSEKTETYNTVHSIYQSDLNLPKQTSTFLSTLTSSSGFTLNKTYGSCANTSSW
jgi:hypothetical protein